MQSAFLPSKNKNRKSVKINSYAEKNNGDYNLENQMNNQEDKRQKAAERMAARNDLDFNPDLKKVDKYTTLSDL